MIIIETSKLISVSILGLTHVNISILLLLLVHPIVSQRIHEHFKYSHGCHDTLFMQGTHPTLCKFQSAVCVRSEDDTIHL